MAVPALGETAHPLRGVILKQMEKNNTQKRQQKKKKKKKKKKKCK